MYNFLVRENRIISDYKCMADALEGIGDRSLNITAGGGTWSAENKKDNVNAVSGVLREFTTPAEGQRDVLLEANEARIHRLLQAAVAEHSLFELKQGLHRLDESAGFDARSFNRILESISAIANDGIGGTGYIMIGVADAEDDAKRIKKLYGTPSLEQHGFYVTGVDHELAQHGSSLDNYVRFFTEKCRNSALDRDLAAQVLRDLRPARYNGRTVLLITVKAGKGPVSYNEKWYERQGSCTVEVPAKEVARLFGRFSN